MKTLKNVVKIKKKDNDAKFDNWFSFNYKISNDDDFFLNKLIKQHKLYLSNYNEEQLKMKFLSPVLNRVDFFFDDIKDWYDYGLSAMINGILLKGRPDFMVAKGDKIPVKPYFFIQEFKPSRSLDDDPEDQLLAEMLVAIKINNKNIMHGCFIIGKHWEFLILEKLKSGNYEYFVHKGLNSLDINHLRQIYINLQAVKVLFCKD